MADQLFDDRVAAYIGSRERLKAAEKLKTTASGELIGGLANPLPPLYWGLLAEAQILADLARVETGVGLAAGTYVVNQQERIENTKTRTRNLLDEAVTRSRENLSGVCPCPVKSAGGRACIYGGGHAWPHKDHRGWSWVSAGEHASEPLRDEDNGS